MIKTNIGDGSGTDKEAHLHERENNVGQIVYSDPLTLFDTATARFLNDTFGNQMAISGGFSGTPELVNNGGDTSAWTGSNIVGNNVDFTSAERPRNGSASVHVDGPGLNDVWQFDRGSDIDLSNYVAITMWINVDRRWGNGDDISFFGYDTNLGVQVGAAVLLEDYIVESDNDTWQEAIIVLSDMDLQDKTIDAFRMSFTSQAGTAPEFFIDDFQIEETTTSASLVVEPDKGELLYVDQLIFNFVDAYDARLASSSMPSLSYDQILNENELLSGISLSRIKNGVLQFSIAYRNLNDFLSRAFEISSAISDGTNTSISLKRVFGEAIRLDSRDGACLTITINDDLSGLISFTALAFRRTRVL